MKVLIINHSNNCIYGASKSLQLLLNNETFEYDLVIPKSFIGRKKTTYYENFYQGNRLHIKKCWLPDSPYYSGIESRSKKGKCYYLFLNFMAKMHLKKFKQSFQKYDFIYLNSLSLLSLIDLDHKYIIHIREVFKGDEKQFHYVLSQLKKAKGIIFIDEATAEPFHEHNLNSIILHNPIDMTKLKDIDVRKTCKYYGLEPNQIVISMLGNIVEFKGVLLVIDAFIRSNRKDIVLLIVGNGHGNYFKECKEHATRCENIRFIGELEDTGPIFSISDYIIRGDNLVAIGRTAWEGLFSGCKIIIPTETMLPKDLNPYKQDVLSYQINSEESLVSLISGLPLETKTEKRYKSNIMPYVEKFNAFVNQSLDF